MHFGWRNGAALALAVLTGGAVAAAFQVALSTNSYNFWGGVVVLPIIIAINVVLIRRVRRDGDLETWLTGLLLGAFALKLVGALARYYVAFVVYSGGADAQRYNLYAAVRYQFWRVGIITFDVGGKQGTQYMEVITTAIYTVIGPSPLAAFIIFAAFAFWGQFFLYRAFTIALPQGNRKRYAVLVLMLPSLLYWPSSIGKESWLMFFVGVTALGAAKLFAHQRGAILLLLLGAAGTALIRPHISVLLFVALLAAQLFRPSRSNGQGILGKAVGLAVLAAGAFILTTQSAEFLGIDDLSVQSVSDEIGTANENASQGGSAFEAQFISSPLDIPGAVATVLFRPFPWEADNAQMLVQSLEGLLLMVLVVRAWPQLRRLPQLLRRTPYLTFCVVYTMAFIWAFSGFGNFGLLARQRVLMIPFFLVLLALPSVDTLKQQFGYRPRERVRVHR